MAQQSAMLRAEEGATVEAETAGSRLRSLRKDAKLSQEALADELGVTRVMLSKYENGDHYVPDPVVERASQYFGVTPAFLRYGDTSSRMAPVVGRIGAGGHVEAFEPGGPPRFVEVPGSWGDAFSLEVDGDSMWPELEDRDLLVMRGERRLIETEFLGKLCSVETTDGRGLVKRVRRGSAPGLYTLESTNARPIEDVGLESARPVRMTLKP